MTNNELPAMNDEKLHTLSDKELLNIVLDNRKIELNFFWQRSNYFLILCTAIIVGIYTSMNNVSNGKLLPIGLSLFGLLVSILWVRVNLGSKYWQSFWEESALEYERKLGTSKLFNITENELNLKVAKFLNKDESRKNWFVNCLTLKRFSPTKQMIFLSLSFSTLFVLLFCYTFFKEGIICL